MTDFDADTGVVSWSNSAPDPDAANRALTPANNDLDFATGLVESARLDGARSQYRTEVLAFCAEHGDALHRSCLEGHLTGSAFVVDPDSKSVLLIHHRKLGRWLQPGGHADGQGNLALVALSEVREETGLDRLNILLPAFDIDVHAIPARPGEPEHLHLDLRFVVVADRSQMLRPADGEVFDARWFAADDPDLLDNHDVNVVARRAIHIVEEMGDVGWPV